MIQEQREVFSICNRLWDVWVNSYWKVPELKRKYLEELYLISIIKMIHLKQEDLLKNSYLSGLTGHEYFYQAAAGREGLIDTAIKTATTGYLQRRLIKALEDIHVCYDGSVRTAQNLMLQMLYGDSGINQAVQTEIKLEIVGMNNKQIEDKYTFSSSEMKKFKKIKNIKEMNKDLLKNMIKYRDRLRKNQIKFSMNYKVLEDKFMLPINFVRIIQENLRDSSKGNKLLDPKYVVERLENFLVMR